MESKENEKAFDVDVQRGGNDDLPYHAVSAFKLIVLSTASFGLYEIVWFYRNWARIKEHTGADIYPFWRAVFSPFYCHALTETVRKSCAGANLQTSLNPVAVTAGYIALMVTARLPDPYWLISFLTFVPLVAIQHSILQLHDGLRPGFDSRVGWGFGSVATTAVGVPLLALAVIGTVMMPPNLAIEGAALPGSYRATLIEEGHLEPNEQIEFFYSGGLMSIREDGNFFTDHRVVSYETIDGTVNRYEAPFDSISEVDVEWSESSLENTRVTITTDESESFLLVVSNEEGRDRQFVAALESRWGDQSH